MKKFNSFTLIELLIVVAVIGALAGVMVSIINTDRQKKIIQDAAKTSNILKLSQGIESFIVAEGRFPIDTNSDGNPVEDTTLPYFVSAWPTSDGPYFYRNVSETGFNFLCISSVMATTSTRYFKYVAPFNSTRTTGGGQGCAGRVLRDCTVPCSSSSAGGGGADTLAANNFTGCVNLDFTNCN